MFLSSGTFIDCGTFGFAWMIRFEPGPKLLEVWQELQVPRFVPTPVSLTARKSACPLTGFPPFNEAGGVRSRFRSRTPLSVPAHANPVAAALRSASSETEPSEGHSPAGATPKTCLI